MTRKSKQQSVWFMAMVMVLFFFMLRFIIWACYRFSPFGWGKDATKWVSDPTEEETILGVLLWVLGLLLLVWMKNF